MDLAILEKNINYKFKNRQMLKKALTHSSYANENGVESYEKLEFLGDSILEFISSKYIYKNHQNLKEGEMSKLRSDVVCEQSLYEVALRNEFDKFLLLGKGLQSSHNSYKSILADTVEAVIAAIYFDSDLAQCEKFIIDNLKVYIDSQSKHAGMKDYKSILQERLQINGEVLIKYELVEEKGPDHDKTFTIKVSCDGKDLAIGSGKSKKVAEMEAACKALEIIK